MHVHSYWGIQCVAWIAYEDGTAWIVESPVNPSLYIAIVVRAICMVHVDVNSSQLHNRTSSLLRNWITEIHWLCIRTPS